MAATSDQNGETKMAMTKRASAVAGKENQLPCPRCDSTNTKFCYYNNYNLSQPRHFCKSCRRYWTLGGALRDIPVGGGSRRSSTKRPRPSPVFLGPTTTTTTTPTHAVSSSLGSFGSQLLTSHGQGPPTGFLAFAGFGFGLEDVGTAACFGLGRGVGWASFPDHLVDDGSIVVGSNGGGHTWQLESGGGGAFVGVGGGVGPDCFPRPDLAISTPGYGLKLN